jgi:hypothetical protein
MRLNVDFQYCYGIKKLNYEFNFQNRVFSVYAPNGVMKTSFAKTFNDFSKDELTTDLHFPERETSRDIIFNPPMNKDNVFVIERYNQDYYESEKMSTLVANIILKKEYETIHKGIDKLQDELLKNVKRLSGLGRYEDIINAIETTFEKPFFDAIIQLKGEILKMENFPIIKVNYPLIFNDAVHRLLQTKDFNKSIKEYIEGYENLAIKSPYLTSDFSFYNAEVVQKQLSENNFFKANHSINLSNGKNKEEYSTDDEFKKLLENEKRRILGSDELKKKFEEINSKITNVNLRSFRDYLSKNRELLLELYNIDEFAKKIWKSYLFDQRDLFLALVKEYESGKERMDRIIGEAKKEQTSWEKVVHDFNIRFNHLPFRLEIKNKKDIILNDEAPTINFVFKDGTEEKIYEESAKEEFLRILSTGEQRALYLLNIIFEVEARKKESIPTLFIVDDIADSFDYKNKYAIVEYLKDISEIDFFYMIILTHNFDFFRTIGSRKISPYNQCLMAIKNEHEIQLKETNCLINPFINDWKSHLDDNKKLIASIPFLRNLIEYTKGGSDPDYILLTSILHHKSNSETLILDNVKQIFFNIMPNTSFPNIPLSKNVISLISETAEVCLLDPEGINFENKIVLSIAIRLKAEQYMKSKITDQNFLTNLESQGNQTGKLFGQFKKEFNGEDRMIEILKRVLMITPENIHLNSFMYEPILDMGDNELRELYCSVRDSLCSNDSP